MKITRYGRLFDKREVFVLIDDKYVIASSEYPDEPEAGMYWFNNWVQQELIKNQGENLLAFNIDYLQGSWAARYGDSHELKGKFLGDYIGDNTRW